MGGSKKRPQGNGPCTEWRPISTEHDRLHSLAAGTWSKPGGQEQPNLEESPQRPLRLLDNRAPEDAGGGRVPTAADDAALLHGGPVDVGDIEAGKNQQKTCSSMQCEDTNATTSHASSVGENGSTWRNEARKSQERGATVKRLKISGTHRADLHLKKSGTRRS